MIVQLFILYATVPKMSSDFGNNFKLFDLIQIKKTFLSKRLDFFRFTNVKTIAILPEF